MFSTVIDSDQFICTTQINLGEDGRTIKDIKKQVHSRKRILILPSQSFEFAVINTQTEATIFVLAKRTSAPVEEELGQMKNFSKLSEMCGGEEVSLLSTWRIHPMTGDRQKEQHSSQLLLLLALPLQPTTPPGIHDKMKEEGPYSQRRDEVKIQDYLLKHLKSL
ncbi:hypothetical protein O181_036818 [Austropuccinia psidii MF-1]|uniref:Uncharacterized protein n=1 Tax=Austropuccinia psidii MF-1 TaxID=1389203 RepID=A0A9Q3D857_9BASI|nr:hypothetical protein [Austropuccinia psidii MF-1]